MPDPGLTEPAVTRNSPPTEPSAAAAYRTELARILDGQLLRARYRPVASVQACGIVGHIGSVTGPLGSVLHSAERLFAVGAEGGELPRLTRQFLSCVFGRYAHQGAPGRLFVYLPAAAVVWLGGELADMIADQLRQTGLASADTAPVLPWLGSLAGVGDRQRAATLGDACRARGLTLVAGGLDGGDPDRSPWRGQVPAYLLLDEDQLDSMDPELIPGTGLADAVLDCRRQGTQVLAQGIRGWRDLQVAQALGIDLMAGDYIGRANFQPAQVLSAAAYKHMRPAPGQPLGAAENSVRLLHRLKADVPPVAPESAAETVFSLFDNNRLLRAVAVVQQGVPIGLISRYEMIDNMARPYRHELFGKKPCVRFMDREPIVVDARLSLTELTDIFVHADPRHLVSGFIITEGGSYAGMGSVQDLMREITAMQIEAARYSNPLTQLPGNVPINHHIDDLLAAGKAFTIGYCDLDHFKPFNDVYGYARGDQVIALTARILSECCEPDIDFVGHVGGDDFILVLRSPDWHERCERALRLFEEEILGFFSHDDIDRGGYVTENRKGVPEFYRLTTLSIGAVEIQPGQFINHLQVSAVATEVKKMAKAMPGNSLYVNRRQYATEPTDPTADGPPEQSGKDIFR